MCGNLGYKKFSRGNAPGPPPSEETTFNTVGWEHITREWESRKGEGREGGERREEEIKEGRGGEDKIARPPLMECDDSMRKWLALARILHQRQPGLLFLPIRECFWFCKWHGP